MTDSKPLDVSKLSPEPPQCATAPTLLRILQMRSTTARLLRILERHTAALEPSSVNIHGITQSSIVISFYSPSSPSITYATVPFATPLPSDPLSPTVQIDEECIGEMVSRIVTLSSLPSTSGKTRKLEIKVNRYLPPDSIISYLSILYYIVVSIVVLSWFFRFQIISLLDLQSYSILHKISPAGRQPSTFDERFKGFMRDYFDFLGRRLFSTDFKFKMIGGMHAWVMTGRLSAVVAVNSKMKTYKVESWGVWLKWILTAALEGRPSVDRFQDEVRRLWIEGMEHDKKDE